MSDNEATQFQVSILVSDSVKAGVYSDYMVARRVGRKTMIDFCLIENASDNALEGSVSSRVILDDEGLVSLRDMLNAHIEGNGIRSMPNV